MNKGHNTPTQTPQVAGVGERNTATNEQAIAHTHFAGLRRLKVVWVMSPVEQFTKASSTTLAGKKG